MTAACSSSIRDKSSATSHRLQCTTRRHAVQLARAARTLSQGHARSNGPRSIGSSCRSGPSGVMTGRISRSSLTRVKFCRNDVATDITIHCSQAVVVFDVNAYHNYASTGEVGAKSGFRVTFEAIVNFPSPFLCLHFNESEVSMPTRICSSATRKTPQPFP